MAAFSSQVQVVLLLSEGKLVVKSPGLLPNSLDVNSVRFGVHVERNPILLSFLSATSNFGYTGRGAGIPRTIRLCESLGTGVELQNDEVRQVFAVAFMYDPTQTFGGVNGGVKLDEEPDACRVIMENPGIKSHRLAEVLGVSQRKMERLLRQLKKNDAIEFRGAPKTGGYFLR